MKNAKPVSTPIAQHFKLSFEDSPKHDEESSQMEKVPYANVTSSTMCLMVYTRPDLAHLL